MENEDFIKRLTALRIATGKSARDLSLNLGQSPNYINNIENGKSLPSLSMFFYICEYLNITPAEFFDIGVQSPTRLKELNEAAAGLTAEEIEHIIAIIKDIKK